MRANRSRATFSNVKKVRIYEVSRAMGVDNIDCMEAAEALGIPFNSHSSSITLAEAREIRGQLGGQIAPRSQRRKAYWAKGAPHRRLTWREFCLA
jgi:hypothetical protein